MLVVDLWKATRYCSMQGYTPINGTREHEYMPKNPYIFTNHQMSGLEQ